MSKQAKIYHVVAMVALIMKDIAGEEFRIEAGAPAKLSEEQYKDVSAYVKVTEVEGDEPPAADTDSEPKTDDAVQTPDATAPPVVSEPQADTVTEPVKTANKPATKSAKA